MLVWARRQDERDRDVYGTGVGERQGQRRVAVVVQGKAARQSIALVLGDRLEHLISTHKQTDARGPWSMTLAPVRSINTDKASATD